MDTFRKTMAACAAVGLFSLGAYVAGSGADAELRSRFDAYHTKMVEKESALVKPTIESDDNQGR